MSEGIGGIGTIHKSSTTDSHSSNYSNSHSQSFTQGNPLQVPQQRGICTDLHGYLQKYCSNLAQSLSSENLAQTLREVGQIASSQPSPSLSPVEHKLHAQVFFLAQLFSEFIEHIETNNVANLRNKEAKASALETVITGLSQQQDFTSTICASLYLATNQSQIPLGRKVGLSLLVQYLTLTHRENSLSNLGVITFTTAICSGWQSDTADSSQLIDLATRILISSLSKEDLSTLSPELRQSFLVAFSSSEDFQDEHSPARKIVQELTDIATTTNNTHNLSNMAERLSPSASGLITNLLAEVGPACTQNVSTLRNTLRQFMKSPNSNATAAIDEKTMSRLIHFFAERGTRKKSDGRDFNHNSISSGWNLMTVVELIGQDFSNLRWNDVAGYFDFPEFLIKDSLHFRALLHLYEAGAEYSLPYGSIVGRRWTNKAGQLSLLVNAFAVAPNVYTFQLLKEEKEDAATAAELDPGARCLNPHGWASWDAVQLLLEFSEDPSLARGVSDLFLGGLLSCPEVMLCTFIRRHLVGQQDITAGAPLRTEIMRELISLFFKPNDRVQKGAPAAIRRLWSLSNKSVEAACVEAWKSTVNESPQNRYAIIFHALNIIRILPKNALEVILKSCKYYEFNIALAFVSVDHDVIKLRPYLDERLKTSDRDRDQFLVELISYIGRYYKQAVPENAGKGSLLSFKSLAMVLIYLKSIDASILSQKISAGNGNEFELQTMVEQLSERCLKDIPKLSAEVPSSDDIEERANSYFQKIYTSEQTIDDAIEMLKRFKSSSNARENDIYACMIHNLFDEYRFFSKYPEIELRITGILFGKLIQHQLVSSITLGIALRYVLEALRKPPGPPSTGIQSNNSGKMFRFGIFALQEFKGRLHEWPQYCSHIVNIQHLKEGYAALVREVEGAMTEGQNRSSSGGSVGGSTNDFNSVPVESADIAGESKTQANGETVSPPAPNLVKREAKFGPGLGRAVTNTNEDVQHDAPTDAVLDRVQFLVNNVTMTNVEQKATDLKEFLDDKYFGWLGHYLVVKRISTQPNYHSTYLAFLEYLGDYGKGLIEAILSSVFLNVGKLLRSPKITTSTSERSLLKNLGSWLGQITLARNKPILQITLDAKELLYQGYENGMLIAVTPFVAKILEGAKNSIVFKPPNPWLMGLLSVFRSLYEVEDLKMNIKFEVEVLCKNLGVKLEDIPLRVEDLSKRIPPVKSGNPDFNTKSSNTANSSVQNGSQNTPNTGEAKQSANTFAAPGVASAALNPPSPSTSGSKDQQTVIPNLASYVLINPTLTQMFQQLGSSGASGNLDNATLKSSVPIAVDRAIREIIQPVVERSVTIACITTKEIVTKDFAMESDENKMRKAAQLMVANLAGSLALVTCREPLRASVSNHLRQLLINAANGNTAGVNDSSSAQLSEPVQNVVDQCVTICSQDNLELGCMLIEKAATEKAVRDIDESLSGALNTRKRHREMSGKPFYDMSIFGNGNQSQRYPSALPEPLRPKPGGLRNEQLLVYEAFQRIPRQPSAQQQTGSTSTSPANVGGASAAPLPGKNGARFSVEALTNIALKLENSVIALLQAAGPRAPEITLGRIPPEHEIKQLLTASRNMTTSVSASGALNSQENDAALGFAQTIFKRLYELRLSEPLRLEAFVALLESLNICCRQLGKDLGTWATYAPTENDAQRKLHRTVLLLLLRSKLLQVDDLDNYLCNRVNAGPVWLDFTLAFIRTAVLEHIIDPNDLVKTMDILYKLSKSGGQSHQVSQQLRTIEEMRGSAKDRATPDASVIKPSTSSNNTEQRMSKPTHQESSSISATSLMNLAQATQRALESIDAISRDDPAALKEQVLYLLDGWMRLSSDAGNNEKMLQYVQLLQTNGIGKNEEQSERFFRISTEVLVAAVLKNATVDEKNQKVFNYTVIDGYGKLIVVLMKHLNSGGTTEEIAKQRISLLNQILGVTMRTMMAHYERTKNEGTASKWDQRPWFRLLLNLVMDLNSPSPIFDPISYGVLSVFGSAFHVVQPLVIPGFAFAWLELISHRMFLSNLLSLKGQKGWALAHQLLMDLFLFLEPHLRKIDLTDSMRQLYKGTTRVLLVLLHDYPAFLAGYHLSFCNVIPENCVQLRNLILSAFPRGMVLPDPFTPNLKIDLLPDISKSPLILSNVAGPLTNIRGNLDEYLKNRQPVDFVTSLLQRLYKENAKEVDKAKVNALVLYVGMHAIAKQQNSKISQSLARTPEIEILQKLMDFDDRGRYIALNAIANQLRFPSSHTHYFSCVMLFLFSEAKDEGVREQVTRVLLERLIVHRPHPWGLLITFIELIKNQRYQFWSHPFTRCATEIEKVFESVARSCLTPGSHKTTTVGGPDES